ncbi:hypothetical protein AAMO2058_001253200, partial [Amorphochlora amoebiformis]
QLLECSKRRRYNKNTLLIKQGEKGSMVYVVAMGFVSVETNQRREATLTACDTFGEVHAVFGSAYTSSYRAITEDVELIEIPANDLVKVLKGTQAFEVLENLSKMKTEESWHNHGQTLSYGPSNSCCPKKIIKRATLFGKREILVHPFTRGAFIGEFDKIIEDRNLSTTLRCTKAGSCFVAPREGYV